MKLTDRQGFSLMSAFLFGNVLSGIGGNGSETKTGYLSVWISLGIFAIFSKMFQKVINEHPGMDFFTVTCRLFGKIGNRIFLVVLVIYSFFASFFSISNYMDFMKYSVTTEFPAKIALFLVLLLTLYLCLKGDKTMGRYAEIILPTVIISVILLLLLGIKEIKEITLPIPKSPSQLLKQGWQIFCSPFSEIMFIWILFDKLQNPENIGKISLKAGVVTTVLFTLIYLFNVNILGENLLKNTRFPTYFSASVTEVGILVENAESLITLSYSFCDILYGSLCLLVGVKGVCKLLENTKFSAKKTKKITTISAVIFMFILYVFGVIQTDLSPYYPIISVLFLPFTIGLPVLVFLLTKTRKNTKESEQ